MNTFGALEEIFGGKARHTRVFSTITWQVSSSMMIGVSDCMRKPNGYRETLAEVIERRHQEQAICDLGVAEGVLRSALDDLIRKGVNRVFSSTDAGVEAGSTLMVLDLVKKKWRKVIRTTPEREIEVQDAFESILVGSGIVYEREKVSIPYATKVYRPDFTIASLNFAIEIKLATDERHEKEFIAQVNDDIRAYKTQYANVLFAIYDVGIIRDIDRFVQDFASTSGVRVCVVKH